MEFLGIRTKSGAIVQPNSGEEMIRKFDFAYSTPGLTAGVTVYTPTVGDVLLDAWIQVTTAFDGTTPLADIGQFAAGNLGWFKFDGHSAIDLTLADDFEMDSAGVLSSSGEINYASATPAPGLPIGSVTLAQAVDFNVQVATGAVSHVRMNRAVPAVFTNSNPVKLVVSQNGQKGGTATGATQGAGTVYFLTGTPQ